jgi:hypothetical protein
MGGYAVGDGGSGGGLYCETATISNCLIAANSGGNGGEELMADHGGNGGDGGGIYCDAGTIANCTVVANTGGRAGKDVSGNGQDGSEGKGAGISAGSDTNIINSIIWGNSEDQIFGHDCNKTTFCNIQDSDCVDLRGNISADPLFIELGYWHTNGTPDNSSDDFWVMGDYHLSQIAAGQPADSPCIDAGSDTAANLGMDIYTTRTDKVWDQGIVDMGYHYHEHIADLNDDGAVDMKDLAILGSQWQQTPAPPSADIVPLTAGDGQVDLQDLALLADWWLWPE